MISIYDYEQTRHRIQNFESHNEYSFPKNKEDIDRKMRQIIKKC